MEAFVVIIILYMGSLRLCEVKGLAQGDTVRQCWIWGSSSEVLLLVLPLLSML